MVEIDANEIRIEIVNNFHVVCDRCGTDMVTISIAGAGEFGEVGDIEIICNRCGASEYSCIKE